MTRPERPDLKVFMHIRHRLHSFRTIMSCVAVIAVVRLIVATFTLEADPHRWSLLEVRIEAPDRSGFRTFSGIETLNSGS
jgi:hypothetical protein